MVSRRVVATTISLSLPVLLVFDVLRTAKVLIDTRVFDFVGERDQNTKFIFLLGVMVRHTQHCPSFQLHVFDFKVGNSSLQLGAPINKSVLSVNNPFIMKADESFSDSVAWGLESLKSAFGF
jgi:hypothetical protein